MSTPFTIIGQPYAGQDPGIEPAFPYGPGNPARFWLGRPIADSVGRGGMIELPSPNTYTPTVGTGEVETGLGSGGSAISRSLYASRRYQLGYKLLTGRRYNVLHAFYRRMFGNGPWCFLAPEDVNRLTIAQSLAGGFNGAVEGWTTGVGTFTTAADGAIGPSWRTIWTGPGVGNLMQPSTMGALIATGIPYISALPWCASAYVKITSGTPPSARMQIRGYQADGNTLVTNQIGAPSTITTGWQQLSVSIPPGALAGSVFISFALECRTASTPPLSLSCPQLEVGSAPSEWSPGMGVPRVTWSAAMGDKATRPTMGQDLDMVLAEQTTGAA